MSNAIVALISFSVGAFLMRLFMAVVEEFKKEKVPKTIAKHEKIEVGKGRRFRLRNGIIVEEVRDVVPCLGKIVGTPIFDDYGYSDLYKVISVPPGIKSKDKDGYLSLPHGFVKGKHVGCAYGDGYDVVKEIRGEI